MPADLELDPDWPPLADESDCDEGGDMQEETASILEELERIREAEDEFDAFHAPAASNTDLACVQGGLPAQLSAPASVAASTHAIAGAVLPVESSEPHKRTGDAVELRNAPKRQRSASVPEDGSLQASASSSPGLPVAAGPSGLQAAGPTGETPSLPRFRMRAKTPLHFASHFYQKLEEEKSAGPRAAGEVTAAAVPRMQRIEDAKASEDLVTGNRQLLLAVVRKYCRYEAKRQLVRENKGEDRSWEAVNRRAQGLEASLKGDKKANALAKFIEQRPEELREDMVEATKKWLVWWDTHKAGHDRREKSEGFRLQGRYCLATYTEDAWVFPTPLRKELEVFGFKDEIDNLEAYCRAQPSMRKIWGRLCSEVIPLQKKTWISGLTLGLEICTSSWVDDAVLRLHAHLVLDFSRRLDTTDLSFLKVCGHLPIDIRTDVPELGDKHVVDYRSDRKRRGGNSASCHFYLQIPKVGKLWHTTSKPAHKSFHVKPQWVLGLVENQKLRLEDAKREYLSTCVSVQRNIENLEAIERAREAEMQAKYLASVQHDLKGLRKEMADPPRWTEWKAQYQQLKPRYKMGVLCGPSSTGKTMKARVAFDSEESRCYEVNCSGGAEPSMRGFKFFYHKWVLLDECKPSQILAQKKFFQAQPVPVVLGTSQTGCHEYKCCVHRVPFLICCNDWEEEVAQLKKKSDVEWLEKNAIVMPVMTALFPEGVGGA